MKVGLLWREEWDPVHEGGWTAEGCRLHGVFAAFAELGVIAEPVVYSDDAAAAVRERLLQLAGVLVWVNPIEQGRDRSTLDPLLRTVADAGVFVSAHPDVIQRIGTKRVLVDTAQMSWSASPHLYESHDQLLAELPARLADRGPLVLKQYWGMGGAGVWRIELRAEDDAGGGPGEVAIQQATKGSLREEVPLGEFLERCRPYFDSGPMVEQPFQSRLVEGMIRVYLSHDRVVGFAHQHPSGLLPPDQAARLPTAKVFLAADEPRYQPLRARVESEWVPELRQLLEIDVVELPVIWDADFLFGPKGADGHDTHLLCEINASSTFAFPEHAMPAVAQATVERINALRLRAADPGR